MVDDATTRFSTRVENYARFRPGYPAAVAELLTRVAGLRQDSIVADIGSGTGLLSLPFLNAGYTVIGIEPNRPMREAGNSLLAAHPGFRSVEGRAEATTLPAHSIDIAVAGQAFHWFDADAARTEWVRILKPGGIGALIWNERFIESPFMRDVEAIIDTYAAEMDPDRSIRDAGRGRIQGFFAPSPYRVDKFPNVQYFGLEGLLGRIASCSFLPEESDPGYGPMSADLARVFHRNEQDGQVRFEYQTRVWWGRL